MNSRSLFVAASLIVCAVGSQAMAQENVDNRCRASSVGRVMSNLYSPQPDPADGAAVVCRAIGAGFAWKFLDPKFANAFSPSPSAAPSLPQGWLNQHTTRSFLPYYSEGVNEKRLTFDVTAKGSGTATVVILDESGIPVSRVLGGRFSKNLHVDVLLPHDPYDRTASDDPTQWPLVTYRAKVAVSTGATWSLMIGESPS